MKSSTVLAMLFELCQMMGEERMMVGMEGDVVVGVSGGSESGQSIPGMFELSPLLNALLVHFWNSSLGFCWPEPVLATVDTVGFGFTAVLMGCTMPPLAVRVFNAGAGAVGGLALPLAPTVVHAVF